MKLFADYVTGILFSPTKAFPRIAKDKKLASCFFLSVGISFLTFGITHFLPVPPGETVSDPDSKKMVQFFDFIMRYEIVWGMVLSFLIPALVNGVAKLFSKKGSYKQLYVMMVLLSVATFVPFMVLHLAEYLYPHDFFFVANLLVVAWTLWLEILLLSSLYGVSKKRAVSFIVFETFVCLSIFVGAMWFYFSL